MKIKEVEQKTKLSAKAIRFYEEKGLLRIKRDDHDYREYDDHDVEVLLTVKLFRKCGLSIYDIYSILNDGVEVESVMYDNISKLNKECLDKEDIKSLCLDVIKAKGDYKRLFEYIETIESEEYISLMNSLEEPPRSLAVQLIQTIMLIAPILWFFLYYSLKKYELLLPVFCISIVATVILTLSWRSFLRSYKFNKETIVQGLSHTFRILLLGIVFVVVIVFAFVGISYIQYALFVKDDVYMFSQSGISFIFSMFVLISLFEVVLGLYGKYFNFKAYEGYIEVLEWIKNHIIIFLVILILSLYLSIVNVTTVSPNKIIHHSFMNPFGTVYSYDDIEKVECGFLGNSFFSFREKGDFFYEVTMKDGKLLKFNDTQTIEEYEDDTYSELVVFDNEIMSRNVIKISNEENSEYALLDQIYIDRFKSIINNK